MKDKKLINVITSGGMLAAATSSICCLGPLLLGALGVGGASSLLFLDEYRPIIVAIVVILIGIGWIMNYRLEKNECKEGTVCADPKGRRKRRVSLSIGTLVAALFIASPLLLSSISKAENAKIAIEGKIKTLYIEGMTCGGCEFGVRKAFLRSGLNDSQILSVDHSTPNPKKNIGSAVIKISDDLNCKVIKEIKSSPGYLAYWSFDNKQPCESK